MELQNSKDWAKVYRACNFIEKGVCEYANERVYVSQDALHKSMQTMKGRPVIIDHQTGITPENMQEYAVGYVTGVDINPIEAGCDCQFVIFDDKGKEVIADGYSVSCAYKPIAFGPGGTWHNVPYDREIVELEFTHLALVQNPRYEDAKVYENAKDRDGSEGRWITVKGTHVFVKGGQSVEDAMKETFKSSPTEKSKSHKKQVKIDDLKSQEQEILKQYWEAAEGSTKRDELQYKLDAIKDERLRLEEDSDIEGKYKGKDKYDPNELLKDIKRAKEEGHVDDVMDFLGIEKAEKGTAFLGAELEGKYAEDDADFDPEQMKKDIKKAQSIGYKTVESVASFLGLDEDEVRETLATTEKSDWQKSKYGNDWQLDGNSGKYAKVSARKDDGYDAKIWDESTGKAAGQKKTFDSKEEAMQWAEKQLEKESKFDHEGFKKFVEGNKKKDIKASKKATLDRIEELQKESGWYGDKDLNKIKESLQRTSDWDEDTITELATKFGEYESKHKAKVKKFDGGTQKKAGNDVKAITETSLSSIEKQLNKASGMWGVFSQGESKLRVEDMGSGAFMIEGFKMPAAKGGAIMAGQNQRLKDLKKDAQAMVLGKVKSTVGKQLSEAGFDFNIDWDGDDSIFIETWKKEKHNSKEDTMNVEEFFNKMGEMIEEKLNACKGKMNEADEEEMENEDDDKFEMDGEVYSKKELVNAFKEKKNAEEAEDEEEKEEEEKQNSNDEFFNAMEERMLQYNKESDKIEVYTQRKGLERGKAIYGK